MSNTLVVVCGWPLSGKSTIARGVQSQLGIDLIDIDELRHELGLTPLSPHPDKDPVLTSLETRDMRAAYRALSRLMETYLKHEQSLILVATMSRKPRQTEIIEAITRYPATRLRVIQCVPTSISDAEVARRLAEREFGQNYFGGVNSRERYDEVRDRFEPIEIPHLTLDTSTSDREAGNIAVAIDYITS